MPELIDKGKLLFYLAAIKPDEYVSAYGEAAVDVINHVETYVNAMPTIYPEVRYGEWHECWHTDTVCASICTNCGKAATQARVIVGQELMTNVRYPLCPNCGAKMDGGARR